MRHSALRRRSDCYVCDALREMTAVQEDALALQRLPSATSSGAGSAALADGTGVDGVTVDVYDADEVELMIDVRNAGAVLLEAPANVDAKSYSVCACLRVKSNISHTFSLFRNSTM